MSFDADHLLKRLQPVVRPCGPEFRPRSARHFDEANFAQLIEMASRGELASGRPVQTSAQSELDEERMNRLSTACDAFEAAGIAHGAVMMEGRIYLLAVEQRLLERELGSEEAGKVQNTEGVIRVLGPDESADSEVDAPKMRSKCAIPAVPPGILAQLERASGAQAH